VIKGWEQWPPAAFIQLAKIWILIQPFSIKKTKNVQQTQQQQE
jgi:hypothetical protein